MYDFFSLFLLYSVRTDSCRQVCTNAHKTLLFLHNYNIENQIRCGIIYDLHPKTILQYLRGNYSHGQSKPGRSTRVLGYGAGHTGMTYTHTCVEGVHTYEKVHFSFLAQSLPSCSYGDSEGVCACVCVSVCSMCVYGWV